MFDQVVILRGEIRCLPLLGLKELRLNSFKVAKKKITRDMWGLHLYLLCPIDYTDMNAQRASNNMIYRPYRYVK